MVAALVAEDDVLLLEAAADADVEGFVPPAVLVDAVSATVKGSGVLCTALAVLDVDGDELLDSARTEVLVGTDVDVASSSATSAATTEVHGFEHINPQSRDPNYCF